MRISDWSSVVCSSDLPKPLGALLGIRSAPPGKASIDYNPSLKADNDLYYGQVAWKPEWFDVKLLGSYQDVHTDLMYDLDSAKQPLVYFHASNQFSKVKSGELQLLRSEEHTSELQSLMRISYAVFCLKKQKII